jgi:hypothetical protein
MNLQYPEGPYDCEPCDITVYTAGNPHQTAAGVDNEILTTWDGRPVFFVDDNLSAIR